ncbi:hypothetical protein PENARI_c012G03560 [Penicillium arizonense]|uniref:Uncharacterized protein n=1 Tax=Penicillium arizonense TaxID=1835702 RepID=A0A1F5LF70_PENAI|nr:hypothetical protein PENARI_c012G03560 [Penicillium arizonense]OGE51747.1 hypothetical protein PENARI_c012G03560 [Penicillium arizonense]
MFPKASSQEELHFHLHFFSISQAARRRGPTLTVSTIRYDQSVQALIECANDTTKQPCFVPATGVIELLPVVFAIKASAHGL